MTALSTLDEKLAIAMWDTGWLTRHYPYGSFCDWDRALDSLVERGYNAIRIDAFPHLVAADCHGRVCERFVRARGEGLILPHPWRNEFETHLEPRAALLEFLPKCRERGVKVGLATWFPDVREERHLEVQGLEAFVRIWDETLAFLDGNGLLDTVIYVDLLNEYPLWHSFEWLHTMLKTMSTPKPEGEPKRRFNTTQIAFFNQFAGDALQRLKAKWPKLDLFFCFSYSDGTPWTDMELAHFDALDVHLWFVQNSEFTEPTKYYPLIHDLKTDDSGYAESHALLMNAWRTEKDQLCAWIRGKMETVARYGRERGIPYGNTEGWGPIMWRQHPMLDWEFVKEAGLIGARYGAELGYTFNCSSNFTHPHHAGLWDDIDWHREVTAIIRG